MSHEKRIYQQPVRLLLESLTNSAKMSPQKTALIIEGESFTYGDLFSATANLAHHLKHKGLSTGDRVAIYMDNTWPCVVSIYATLIAGGVFIIINPQTKADKLKFILEDSDASLLMTDIHLSNNLIDIIRNPSKLKGVICSNYSSGSIENEPAGFIEPFEKIIKDSETATPITNSISLDLAALIYTSGSTGNPKGVMMTHQSMVFAAQSLIEYLRLSPEHCIINMLPLAFDYGLYQLIMTIFLGATLVLERSFTYPAQILNRIKQFDVTVFPGVPTIYATLAGMHNRNPLCFPSVTRITNTAAALPSDYQPILRQIFPNALIYRMYGLTECKRVCYLDPELADTKPTSVGKAIPGTQAFILSPKGKPVPPGTPGILYVRGPHVMKGYWKQPKLSAHMLKPGPLPGEFMLCTQDWFKMDADGDLYFLGRSDDIIKTRGEKVSPVEVENVLYGISGIKEAAVIGVPDQLLGQAVKAFVVLEKHAVISEKEILKVCSLKLENFMVPKVIEFRDSLSKTTTGKISKNGLL